jgi:phosphoglycolate phosphatase-like HAD superfamily hydrolase
MLVLFDIDGTLVRRAGPCHRQALEKAIHHVTGCLTTTDGIPLHGMLDQDILSQMMQREGMSARRIAAAMPVIHHHAQRIYIRTCPDIRDKTCPGVRSLLYRLTRRKIPLALVTGNLTKIGWKKLERAGLKDYFLFGAFAEMAATRAGLAKLAIETARKRGLSTDSVALIGDAPSDIEAAKANGIRSISVATGISNSEELAALNPDVLLEDLRHFRWEMLCGELMKYNR